MRRGPYTLTGQRPQPIVHFTAEFVLTLKDYSTSQGLGYRVTV
jgi:hypothetical protein